MGQNLCWKNLAEDLCALGVVKSSQQRVGSQWQRLVFARQVQVSAIAQMPTRPLFDCVEKEKGEKNE